MNVHELLERHVARGAERPLVIAPEGTASGGTIARDAARIAAWLRTAGIGAGERVLIDLKNSAFATAALFGVARAGAIVVAGSPQWTPAQVEYVLADSGARALIASELRARQLGTRCPPHVLATLDATPPPDDAPIARTAGASAIVIYTSGSTGRPKGVVHPHENLVAFGEIVAGYLANTADDRLLWVLGWAFGYGLSQLLSTCVAGGSLIVPASMLPADICRAHDAHAATGLAQVPYGWDQLVGFLERTGRTLAGLRYVTNAGDGPTPALIARMQRALPGADIVLMYGQTECLRTTYLPAAQLATKGCAMGYPIPGVELQILDEHGRPCGVDEPGELHHAGALVATGYWNDPDETARKFREARGRRSLATGDIVRRDRDGCLWYVARSDLMIKSSGFRFAPRELEDAVASHHAVAEAVAFGIDDPSHGQAVEVAVVMHAGALAPELVESTLHAHLRPLLPRYMMPRRFHVVDAIPRNARGKRDVAALRALARA